MNNNYIYYNGKATIFEDNGNQKEVDYYDNLNEVLERENLIETLERKSNDISKDVNFNKQQYKKSRKEYIDSILWILFPLIIYALFLIFTHFFGIHDINTTIGTFDYGVFETIVTAFFTTPVGIILANSNYKYRKDLQKKINLKENDIEKIKHQINLQKKRIEELKKDKINSNEDNYFVTSLNKVSKVNYINDFMLETLGDLIIEDNLSNEEQVPVLKKTFKN